MPTLGDIIKKYRVEHEMSMDDFAKKSGMSKSYISVLEKNKRPGSKTPIQPSFNCVKQAADAMEMNFLELSLLLFGKEIEENFKDLSFVAPEDYDIIKVLIDNGLYNNLESSDNMVKESDAKSKYITSKYAKLKKHFSDLNTIGKEEAVKRVEELTHIEKYTQPDDK